MNTAVAPKQRDLSTDQELSPQEFDQARLFLQQTQNSIIGATKGLSDAQWKFKPSPDRWSIAENLDHIVIVQERVLGPIASQLADAPAPPNGFDRQIIDEIVINQFPVRLTKFQAPEFVHPADRIVPAELLRRLTENYARLNDLVESRVRLRQHAIEAAPLRAVSKGVFSHMDGYQWILAAAAHTERHTTQILEVMADPNYPV